MAFAMPPGLRRHVLHALGMAVVSLVLACEPAHAFSFFGLFGTDDEAPPAATANAISYAVSFQGTDDSDLLRSLKDASTLERLRQDAPPEGESVLRRAEADLLRLPEALWGAGYYNGVVSILVDGVPLGSDRGHGLALRRIADFRGRAPVPIRVVAVPGPLFTIRSIVVEDARTRAPFDPWQLPPRVIRLKDGDAASSANVLAAEARIIDHLRGQGYPFAKVLRREPVVDHPSMTMSVAFLVDPGPLAGLGAVTVRGTTNVDPAVIRSFIYTQPGDPYSPRAVADIRKSVSRIDALGSVRVREADALDAYGNLPLTVDVTERPPRIVGFGLRYSTIDGPGVHAYWAHRNLFGGAERLRFDADLYRLDRNRPINPITGKERGFEWSDLGGRFAVSFLKPALWGTRNDLLIDAFAARESTDYYTSRAVGSTAAIRHRFSDTFSVQGGIEFERGEASEFLGAIDYTLVGLPVSVIYDSTDNPLDPSRGVKFTGSLTPYPAALGSDPGIFVARAQGSTYYALDEDARYILAARLGLGSITGADLDEIPANHRFFAGGGGSVRGYKYRSLSPLGPFGEPIGGRSLVEGSLEARIKVTDVIGIVPFLDAGTAFESGFPDFDDSIRYAAGIGLRYYTGIGPIRVDVAFPINPRRGDAPAALYISLGQAF
jgi:translocation and assembly module TamA